MNSSLTSFQSKHAALRKISIVVQARYLEPADFQLLRHQCFIAFAALTAKPGDGNRIDPGYCLRGGDDGTEKYWLAKSEIVRMEDSPSSVRLRPVAEDLEQCLFDVGEKISSLYANQHFDFERNWSRTIHLEILPRHAIALEAAAQIPFEVRFDCRSAEAIDRQKHRVPTTSPAKRRRGALHLEVTALGYIPASRELFVIARGDRTFLTAKCAGSVLPYVLDRLGLEAASRGQRVAHAFDRFIEEEGAGSCHMLDGI